MNNFCESPDVLWIVSIIIKVIYIIRIAVPIILIISLMIDFVRALISKEEDSLNKALGLCIKKIILAILVFLIPVFVNVIVGVVATEDYRDCIDLTNTVDIKDIYERKAQELIDKYKETKKKVDYKKAKEYINKIRITDIKEKYLKLLEKVRKELN